MTNRLATLGKNRLSSLGKKVYEAPTEWLRTQEVPEVLSQHPKPSTIITEPLTQSEITEQQELEQRNAIYKYMRENPEAIRNIQRQNENKLIQDYFVGLPETRTPYEARERQSRSSLAFGGTDDSYWRKTYLAKAKRAQIKKLKEQGLIPDERREYEGFWDELGRNTVGGGLNVASGLTGTLASMSEGAIWDPDKLEQWAQKLHKKAQEPAYTAAKGGGWKGFVGASIGQAVPYMGAATASVLITGQPYAAFGVGFSVEGDNAYRDALEAGATEEQAQMNRFVVGTINGVIEQIQVSRVFKFAKAGKGSMQAVSKLARQKAMKKIAQKGGKLTLEAFQHAIKEATEESLQELTSIAAEARINPDAWNNATDRILRSGLGGGVVGLGLGTGGRIISPRQKANRLEGLQPKPVEDIQTWEDIKQDKEIAELDRELAEIQAQAMAETPSTVGIPGPEQAIQPRTTDKGVELPPKPTVLKPGLEKPKTPIEKGMVQQMDEMAQPVSKAEPAKVEPKTIEDLREKISDEELSGITKPERRRLIKENAAKIEASDIYQNEVSGLETAAREVGPGYYYIDKGYRGEVEAIIGKRKGYPTKIQKMFTFNPNEKRIITLQSGEKAQIGPTPWESAVQEGLGRGKEGVEETHGEMDISEFVQRVVDSYRAQETIGGINKQALEKAEQSGYPDLQMLAEKHRMLAEGFSDQQINEMISEWAGEWGIETEDIADEFVNEYGTRIRQIKKMEDPDAALEQLATEQIEAEDRQEAVRSAKEVLEANDIQAEVEQVEEIRPMDLLGRPVLEGGAAGKQRGLGELGLEFTKPEVKDPDQLEFGDTIPFERRGRPVGASLTLGQKQIILLAIGADSETGYHEGYHTYLRVRNLTAKDRRVLDKYYKGDDEAEATAFARYIKTGKAPTFLRGIWQKLRNLLRKVRNGLAGRGLRTPEDIFGEIYKGTLKAEKQVARPGIAFETRPIFYSKLERAVQTMPAKMSSQAFRNWASKQGIKKEEMLWSGIDDLLAKTVTVNKQQVLDTIAANNIQIEEVTKGEPSPEDKRDLHVINEEVNAANRAYAQYRGEGFALLHESEIGTRTDRQNWMDSLVYEAEPERAREAQRQLKKAVPQFDWLKLRRLGMAERNLRSEQAMALQRSHAANTQFSQYTLPGGENYTELLLRWAAPTIDRATRRIKAGYAAAHQMHAKDIEGISRKIREGEYIGGRAADIGAPRTLEYLQNRRAELERILEEMTEPVGPTSEIYRSPHWKETNVLAHIRFTDRWTPGEKRVLFIEEIQSDWHQVGRKKGYRKEITEEQRREIGRQSSEAGYDVTQTGEYKLTVPDAPFKKTWHELSLKRMLRYAAENGYDQLAWTTGEQQAERYDLSKQISKVMLIEDWGGQGKHLLQAWDLEGVSRITQHNVTEDNLADYIGKEAAERLLKAEYTEIAEGAYGQARRGRTLTGLDLKVGGEGMKAFYDRMVPQFLRKYAKRWGATIGTTRIEAGRTVEGEPVDLSVYKDIELIGGKKVYEKVPTMSITPKMKESVMAGQVQFETSGEKFRREVDKKARIKAREARIAAKNGIKRKRRVRQAPRIRIKLQDHTPPLREDLAPLPADLPPGKPVMFSERKLRRTMPVSDKPVPEEVLEANRQNQRIKDTIKEIKRQTWKMGEGVERAFNSISSRLFDINPELKRRIRDLEEVKLGRIARDLRDVNPLFKAFGKMKGKDWKDMDLFIKNGDVGGIEEMVKKYNLQGQMEKFREIDDAIYEAANEVGMEVDHRRGHFHRRVRLPKELMAYIKKHYGNTVLMSRFEAALAKRKEQAGGRALTPEERAKVLNSVLRGYGGRHIWLSKPGGAKERSLFFIDENINKFYYDTKKALEMYIRDMHEGIAEREFFGRETKQIQRLRATKSRLATSLHKLQTKQGRQGPMIEQRYKDHISKRWAKLQEVTQQLEDIKHQDLNQTIGGYIVDLVNSHVISDPQQDKVQSALEAYFNPRPLSPRASFMKKIAYMTHIGSPIQTATQLKDYGRALYRAPLQVPGATMRAFVPGLKSKYSMEELGLTDISVDMASVGGLLNKTLRATGFRWLDMKMKEMYDDAVMTQFQQQAKRKANLREGSAFIERLQKVFGENTQQIIIDLKAKRKTTLTKKLAFNVVLDMHPVARSEMTETYLKGGGITKYMYTLRTFGLKEFEYARNEIFRDMKKHPVRSLQRLTWLAFTLALAGAGVETLKDLMRGRKPKPTEEVTDAWLNLIFMSRYGIDILRREGPGRGFFRLVTPPTRHIDAPVRDIIKGEFSETPMNIPIGGEFYYWWFGEGRRKLERKEGKTAGAAID